MNKISIKVKDLMQRAVIIHKINSNRIRKIVVLQKLKIIKYVNFLLCKFYSFIYFHGVLTHKNANM